MRIAKGQNQDGRWGAHRVQVSPQLGHLLDTGGEPRHLVDGRNPPEAWYKVEGSEQGEAAEDGGDQPA